MKTKIRLIATMGLTILMTFPLKAEMGMAQIKGTTLESNLSGTVTFVDGKEGLTVTVNVKGVPPGSHGFHIHEFGSCDDLGKAAGSHYNPMNTPHGLASKDGMKKAHAGD